MLDPSTPTGISMKRQATAASASFRGGSRILGAALAASHALARREGPPNQVTA